MNKTIELLKGKIFSLNDWSFLDELSGKGTSIFLNFLNDDEKLNILEKIFNSVPKPPSPDQITASDWLSKTIRPWTKGFLNAISSINKKTIKSMSFPCDVKIFVEIERIIYEENKQFLSYIKYRPGDNQVLEHYKNIIIKEGITEKDIDVLIELMIRVADKSIFDTIKLKLQGIGNYIQEQRKLTSDLVSLLTLSRKLIVTNDKDADIIFNNNSNLLFQFLRIGDKGTTDSPTRQIEQTADETKLEAEALWHILVKFPTGQESGTPLRFSQDGVNIYRNFAVGQDISTVTEFEKIILDKKMLAPILASIREKQSPAFTIFKNIINKLTSEQIYKIILPYLAANFDVWFEIFDKIKIKTIIEISTKSSPNEQQLIVNDAFKILKTDINNYKLLNRLHYLLVTLRNMKIGEESFWNLFDKYVMEISPREISIIPFNYNDDPINRGWKPKGRTQSRPTYNYRNDEYYGNIYEIKAIFENSLDYDFKPISSNCRTLEFVVTRDIISLLGIDNPKSAIYAFIKIKDNSKKEVSYVFNIQIGDNEPKKHPTAPDEWFVFITPMDQKSGWISIRINLLEQVEKILKNTDFEYVGLSCIRLRGSLGISKITLFWNF
jgi:hypothetical protein